MSIMGTILWEENSWLGDARKNAPPSDDMGGEDELWKRIDPAIQKAYPPKPRGRHRINLRQALKTASSSVCVRGAGGTSCRSGLETTAAFTAGSSDGAKTALQ
jgi:hypothetical protein